MEQKLLGTLTVQQATALARYDCEELDLGDLGTGVGLGTIIDDKSLGGGLTTLNADAAEALAEFKGTGLAIPALAMLDADTAEALAKFKGEYLSLHGLTTLDIDTAKALAKFKGDRLHFNGLTTLDAATAKALAKFKGRLYLPGLTAPDSDAAATLRTNPAAKFPRR